MKMSLLLAIFIPVLWARDQELRVYKYHVPFEIVCSLPLLYSRPFFIALSTSHYLSVPSLSFSRVISRTLLSKMVAINSLFPHLAAVLLFTGSTGAIPANVLPRRTLDVRAATTSAGTVTSAASASGTTAGPKIVFTETNNAGAINGCTSTSLVPYTDSNNVASTDTVCVGSRFPISTNSKIASSEAAIVSSLVPVAVPDQGCAIGTKHDGSNQGYCTCAGSGSASASSVSTILAYSSGNLTTVCNTGAGSVPTNYVEVPEIKTEDITAQHPIWANSPTDAVAGNCTSADILDARCWEALNMDDYVKWWWGAFNSTCEGTQFAECFYKVMTPYSPSDCSILAVDGPCRQPAWADFKNNWNGVRNAYVAVSHPIPPFYISAELTFSLVVESIQHQCVLC